MKKSKSISKKRLEGTGNIGTLPEIFDIYHSPGDLKLLPFYEELAKKYGEPMLELGCSTAYLLIPLARKGIEAAGIDMNKTLLDYGRKKILKEPKVTRDKITLIEGNILDLTLNKKFKVIYMTAGVFIEFLTQEEQIKMLKQVNSWLHPEGIFVLESEIPHYKLQGWGGYKGDCLLSWTKYIPELDRTVYSWDARNWDHFTQTAEWMEIEDLVDKEGNVKRSKTSGKVRYTYPSEIELLFKLTGFEVADRVEGYDQHPFDAKSTWVLYLARKK